MLILGIETSCDETCAAVLRDGRVLSSVVSSQLVHGAYGGVVPELASRAHQQTLSGIVGEALRSAGVRKEDLSGIAATRGPGLVGALLVGLTFGKAMAWGLGIPFAGVNHMEGHLYSGFLEGEQPEYPFLTLIVSGGHTMLVLSSEPLGHRVLGSTRDDAAGEAFDKVAKMLGLGYPGGPAIDRRARGGNQAAIPFPRARLEGDTLDFSFSGVKTSVLYYLRKREGGKTPPGEVLPLSDICASFQEAVVDVLEEKTFDAARRSGVKRIGVAGGVAANSRLRERFMKRAEGEHLRVAFPPLSYCMDNAAMIAYVGWMRLSRGMASGLDTPAAAALEPA
ncbi:MAG: tRNA (adenosine(37)-N6)-threonylcarbamoyltransferase complex transferase subunit TsaD [Bacteroidota bacterium]